MKILEDVIHSVIIVLWKHDCDRAEMCWFEVGYYRKSRCGINRGESWIILFISFLTFTSRHTWVVCSRWAVSCEKSVAENDKKSYRHYHILAGESDMIVLRGAVWRMTCRGPRTDTLRILSFNCVIKTQWSKFNYYYFVLLSIKLWQVADGLPIQSVSHVGCITCVSFSPDSQYFVTGSEDMSLKVWEANTGKLTQVILT